VAGGRPYMAQAGLLIDWLELLDPSVVSACPELQQELVFGRRARVGEGRGSRPYLLSLLTHQASWQVLRSTVASVLASPTSPSISTTSSVTSATSPATVLDPGAVLDFLTACIHIPRLWQGRDQRPPVHSQPPDVLDLQGASLQALVDYVLEEAAMAEEPRRVVMARMDLVLRCLASRAKLGVAVDHLLGRVEGRVEGSAIARDFLTELYMRVPASLASPHPLLPSSCPLAGESVVDSVSHTLLSSLSTVQQGKQWAVRMQELEVATRKLLASHPTLFLRNLPLLASSLQGRVHLEYPVFRSRNHLTLFTIHLGLLELARPHLFHSSNLTSLEAALGCYLEMIDSYFQRRDSFYYTIDRIVQLLASWQAAGGVAAQRAASFLRQHAGLLLRLHAAPGTNKMESLRGLVAGLAPALHSSAGEQGGEDEPRLHIVESLEPDLARLLADLQGCDGDRLVPLLQEVQSLSNPRPSILGHFTEELTIHMASNNNQVRSLSYTLLLKQLKQKPSSWEALLPPYLACLSSGEEGRVEAALQHLPEFAVLCQQKAGELLSAVFRLGIYSNIAATPHINAAIARLNMQQGN